LQSSGEVKDSIDFLDLLEREQRGADLPDFDGFQAMVNQLKAQADPRATEKLQLMTIHEAKGLQFDTVILPGLGRGSGRESTELFLYHEGLMAPIQESGGDKDEIYQYLREIDKKKTANELVRLLYVACTRAKSRLHLLGFVTASNGKPPGNSLLAVLWKGMDADERQIFVDAAHGPTEEEKAAGPQPSLRRLPLAWRPPEAVPPVKWSRPEERAELEREPTFEWVGDNLRHAGTVVHAILQRLARNPAYQPAAGVIRQSLAQLGVPRTELEATATRVRQAISCTLASPRGQWILSPHQDSRCELSVAARVDGQTLSGRIDRTFIDSSGTRWIVDFKTSWHEGGGLDRFLDEQHRRYREQLEHYGRLFAAKGAPVRLGLYFPLLDAWREWPL
jgi:ATP-dependent exoDNAse (exonuclease V) beta subunit